MSTIANGYYGATSTPVAGAAPGWPQPVVVPVNNAGQANQFNTDAYVSTAMQAAPYLSGAVPGKAAASKMGEAAGFIEKARGARGTSARAMTAKANASKMGSSLALGSVWGAIRSSLIVNGIITLAVNGYGVFGSKKITKGDGAANVAGDMTSAVVGGAAGGVATMIGSRVAIAMGMGAGLPLTLLGIGLGIGGYLVADQFLKKTAIYQQIKTSVKNMVGV